MRWAEMAKAKTKTWIKNPLYVYFLVVAVVFYDDDDDDDDDTLLLLGTLLVKTRFLEL